MKVKINGKDEAVVAGTTILGYLQEKNVEPAGVVIEYNGSILDKDRWDEEEIEAGDRIEIIKIVGGG
ncbi:MAG: sulfur carrier protein ThiS [Bacillota bacterium]